MKKTYTLKTLARRLRRTGLTYRQLDLVLFARHGNGTRSFRLLSK